MTEKRPLSMEKFDMSENAYRELYYFCLRYDEKKSLLRSCYDLKGNVLTGMPRGNAISSPTEKMAEKALRLRKDIEDIEQAAIEADSEIYEYIINNVARGVKYEYMDIPCGRRRFYEKRRLFFYLLYTKRG